MRLKSYHIRGNNECGAAIAFIVVGLTAILSLMALAIDYHLAMTSRDQASYLAGTCVTAALDEYFQPQSSGTLEQRYQNALNRCQNGANYGLDQNKIGNGSAAELQVQSDTASSGIKLEVGAWAKDSTTHNMTFIPTLSSNITNTNLSGLNAMRVSGSVPGGYLTNFTRRLLGTSSVPLTVSAVASVVPRRGCFLVDVSGSMTSDSHPRDKGLFAFSVEQILTKDHEAQKLWDSLPRFRPAFDTSLTKFYKSDYILMSTIGDGADPGSRGDGAIFEHAPLATDNRFTRMPPQLVSAAVSYGIKNGAGAPTSSQTRSTAYLIDAPRPVGTGTILQRRPEPLRSIFDAINQAMIKYQNQRVAGDEACLIVYDSNIDWARTINLSSDFEFLKSLTDFESQYSAFVTAYSNLRLGSSININGTTTSISSTPTLTTFLSNIVSAPETIIPNGEISEGNIFMRGMFPTALGYSDTTSASQEAINQFIKVDQSGNPHPPAIKTADYVVMIGDGLGNCVPCNDASQDGELNCASSVGSAPTTARCLDNIRYNNTVMAQLDLQVRNPTFGYQARKAQIHVMPIGNTILPHTVDMGAFKGLAADGSCKVDSNSCMSDQDFRSLVTEDFSTFTKCYSYVNDLSTTIGHSGLWQFTGGSYESLFQDKDASHPYYIINAFIYRLAGATGGMWAPVRPLDTNLCTGGRTDCVIDDYGHKDPNCIPTWVPKCGSAKSTLYCYNPGAGATCTPGKKDLEVPAMRSTDPFCRTPRQQMVSYMNDFLALRPISLGQVK